MLLLDVKLINLPQAAGTHPTYRSSGNSVPFGQYPLKLTTFTYLNHGMLRQFRKSVTLSHTPGAVAKIVVSITSSSIVPEIGQSIIEFIAIIVAHNVSDGSRPNKRFKNHDGDSAYSLLTVPTQRNT